jgi:hypothetical protein
VLVPLQAIGPFKPNLIRKLNKLNKGQMDELIHNTDIQGDQKVSVHLMITVQKDAKIF